MIFNIDLDPLFDYYSRGLDFKLRTHHMNALIIFLVRLILGLAFGILLTRLFRPDWTIFHGMGMGILLVGLTYGLIFFRKKKQS